MKSILALLVLLTATTTFASQPKAFEGTWVRKSMPAGAENVCPPNLALKLNNGLFGGHTLSITQYDRTDKYGNLGGDGKVNGGCSSGWSAFDVDNSSGCSYDMTRTEVSANKVSLSNFNCADKKCVERQESYSVDYEALSDGSLSISTLTSGNMNSTPVTCSYSRAQ